MKTSRQYAGRDVGELLASLRDRGVRLAVIDGKLKAFGELADEERHELRDQRETVTRIIGEAQKGRTASLDEKLREWRAHCDESRGYDWAATDWRTAHHRQELVRARRAYILGEVELKAVHAAFVSYAKAHKPDRQVNDDGRRRSCCSPQVEPQPEDFERLLRVFGIERNDYVELRRVR